MISDDPEDYSNKTANNKNNKNDASSVSLLSNATSEQSDLNESRDENLIDYEPLFLQVSISIRHGKDTMVTAPISQLPTCLVDLFKVRIIRFLFSLNSETLGALSRSDTGYLVVITTLISSLVS